MKRKQMPPTWVVDYSAARAEAIKWLGDRYLLARPINAGHYESWRPAADTALATGAHELSPGRSH